MAKKYSRPTKETQLKREQKALDALARVYLEKTSRRSGEEYFDSSTSLRIIREALNIEAEEEVKPIITPAPSDLITEPILELDEDDDDDEYSFLKKKYPKAWKKYERELRLMYDWHVDFNAFETSYDIKLSASLISKRDIESSTVLFSLIALIKIFIEDGMDKDTATRTALSRWKDTCSKLANAASHMQLCRILFKKSAYSEELIGYTGRYKTILNELLKECLIH